MLGDWVNVFHLDPASFWAATPHEYLAACEANRKPAAKAKRGSSLTPEDVRRLKAQMDTAKAAEARHRAEQKAHGTDQG